MHPELAGAYDLTVFLSVSPELQHERIMRRNGERAAISSSAGSRLRRNISAKWTFRRAVGLYLRHETNKSPRRAEIC